MKKKAYISPVAEILENSPEQLLTGSGFITEDGDVWVDDTGEGDASEGCSRGLDDWFDYFKTLLVLVMMTAGLTVQAQKIQRAEASEHHRPLSLSGSQQKALYSLQLQTEQADNLLLLSYLSVPGSDRKEALQCTAPGWKQSQIFPSH